MLDDYAAALQGGQVGAAQFKQIMQIALEIANSYTPVDTGRLLSNNRLEVVTPKSIVLYNKTPYAWYVHEGTSRHQPRPFFRIALNYVREKFPEIYVKDAQDFWQKLVSKYGGVGNVVAAAGG